MTPTPEPLPEFLLNLARIAESDPNSVTVQEQELLEWVDSLTQQRDEAQRRTAELEVFRSSAQGTINHFRNRADKAEVAVMQAGRLADAQDGRDGYVMVYALRAALAVTAPPPDEHGATTQPHAFLDDSHGICGFEDANENDCGGRHDDPTHVTAPPETPGEKLLRDIFTDPGQRELKKVAEGFHAFGKAAAWPPAAPVEEPADYSPLCAECEAVDREQPMCNDCHATFQREHAARTARARRLGSAGPVKEDRP